MSGVSSSEGALRAFRLVATNAAVRRVELAWAGSVTGQWAFGIAMSVYAFRAGGASTLGLLILLRLLPAILVGPYTGALADRFRRELVMIGADIVRAAAAGAAAIAAALSAPPAAVFALAVVVAAASSAFRPAEAAIMPSLARGAEELTAANVVSSMIGSTGALVGPALGGLLLAATSTSVVFSTTAATFLCSAALIAGIRTERPRADAGPHRATDFVAGFRTILGDDRLRLVGGLYAAQCFVVGAQNVLIVEGALAVLKLGNSGVGWLTTAFGAGGLIGGLVATSFVGRQNLSNRFAVGVVVSGIPIALIGFWPQVLVAIACLAVSGAGDAVTEVAGQTLIQRSVRDDVLGRVFGVLVATLLLALAAGAVLIGLIVDALGARPSFVLAGVVVPAVAAVLWPRLAKQDALPPDEERVESLRAVDVFALLPPETLEALAREAIPAHFDANQRILAQGEPGGDVYVVTEGEISIAVDGEPIAKVTPGQLLGEISLLRDIPRTASATALTKVRLLRLKGDAFIAAVNSHAPSAAAARSTADARLAGTQRRLATFAG